MEKRDARSVFRRGLQYWLPATAVILATLGTGEWIRRQASDLAAAADECNPRIDVCENAAMPDAALNAPRSPTDSARGEDSPSDAQPPVPEPVDGILAEHLVFADEPIDTQWAAPLESQVFAEIAANGFELSSFDAECRSASCRIILRHAVPVSGLQVMNDLGVKVNQLAESWVVENAASLSGHKTTVYVDSQVDLGMVTTIVYLYRDLSFGGLLFCGALETAQLAPDMRGAMQERDHFALCRQRRSP